MSSAIQPTTGRLELELTPQRLRVWGIRSGLSVLDQGLTSGAGFILNLLLARWLLSEAYGAFAVAFATFLFISGFHNVLLLEPMSVIGPASYSRRLPEYFIAQLKLHGALITLLSALMLMTAEIMLLIGVHRDLVVALAASAVVLPFLLLLWLVRRMCYIVSRPAIATWASAGYVILIAAGLFALHSNGQLSPLTAFLLMGAASAVAAIVPLRHLGLLSSEGRCSLRDVLRQNWRYGRWLVASTTLFSVTSQIQTYLAAALLGLGAAGVLRAMQVPSLVMTQIVIAMGLLVLPSMAREYGLGQHQRLRKKAMLATSFLTAMAMVYAVLLWAFAKPLEQLLYGGKFASNALLIPLLGLVPVCTGFSMGFSMAVRASQKPHFDLLANAISAPVGLITAVVFIKMWGLTGAAVSLAAGFAAYGAVFYCSFKRMGTQGSV